jgi:tryptophan synthase alpha subunit
MEILHNFFSALVSYDPDKDIEESDKMNDLLHEIHYLRDPSRILGTDVCEVQKFYMAGGNVNAMLFGSPIIKELLEDQMEETETLVNQLKTLISLGADVNATGKMEKLLCPQH